MALGGVGVSVARLDEALATDWADIRFLPRVGHQVLLQTVFPGEGGLTHFTLVGLVAGVGTLVGPQFGPRGKSPVTTFKTALEWPVLGLCMDLEMVLLQLWPRLEAA